MATKTANTLALPVEFPTLHIGQRHFSAGTEALGEMISRILHTLKMAPAIAFFIVHIHRISAHIPRIKMSFSAPRSSWTEVGEVIFVRWERLLWRAPLTEC